MIKRYNFALALIISLVFVPAIGRAEAVPCKTLKWIYSRNRSLQDLQQDFAVVPRSELIRYSWTELLENRKDSVAVPMLHYLASTTSRDRVRQYFEAMGFLVLPNEMTPSEAVRTWPKRMKTKKFPISLDALCALYRKALDERPIGAD